MSLAELDSDFVLPDDAFLELIPTAVSLCDARGAILKYNRRAAELWGRAPQPGGTKQLFSGAHRLFRPDGAELPHDETPMATAIREGASCRDREIWIERPDGSCVCASVNVDPIRDRAGRIVGAINCFADITARKSAEERLRASQKYFHDLLQAVPVALYTTDATGAIDFYNQAAADLWGTEPELGVSEWCGSWKLYWSDGTPLPHAECPMAIALKEGRPVRDVEALAERPDGTRVPFMPFPTPLYDEAGRLTGAVNVLVDITYHRNARQQLQLLVDELNHRVKNTLATILSMSTHTRRHSQLLEDFIRVFEGRLKALSGAHDLLTETNWAGASLRDIMIRLLQPHGRAERVGLPAHDVSLNARQALTLSMVVHELATNAAKYGALSAPDGRIDVDWTVDGPADESGPQQVLRFAWRERGGPAVAPPDHAGFGTRLIRRAVDTELGGVGDIRFEPGGLRCLISFPLTGDAPPPTGASAPANVFEIAGGR